jgi:hypothetical protein
MIAEPDAFFRREYTVNGSDVAVNLSLTDQSLAYDTKGTVFRYASTRGTFDYLANTPAGTYAVKLGDATGAILTGTAAKNFYVPDAVVKAYDGKLLGITPSLIGYRISGGGGLYIQGIGWVGGAGGGAVLNGVYGDDQVSLIVGAYQKTTRFERGGVLTQPTFENDPTRRQGTFFESFEAVRDITPYNQGSSPSWCDNVYCTRDPGGVTRATDLYLEVGGLIANSRNYILRLPGGGWSQGAPMTLYPRAITDLPLAGIPSNAVDHAINSAINIVQSTGAREAAEQSIADMLLATTLTAEYTKEEQGKAGSTALSSSAKEAIQARVKAELDKVIGGRIAAAEEELGRTRFQDELEDTRTVTNTNTIGTAQNINTVTTTSTATIAVSATKVQMSASNSNEVSTLVTYGPGYTGAGIQNNQSVTMTADLMSGKIAISASTRISAYIMTGVEGSIDGLGDGKAESRAEVFAAAAADGTLSVEKGKLKLGSEVMAGGGASATATASLSGSVAGVSAGAGIYSPGTVALGVSATAGVDGSTLEVGAHIAIGIGLIGFTIDFNFKIDFAEAYTKWRGWMDDITVDRIYDDKASLVRASYDTVMKWDVLNDPQGLLDAYNRNAWIREAVSHWEGSTDIEDRIVTAQRLVQVKKTYAAQIAAEQAILTKLIKAPQTMTKADLDTMMAMKKNDGVVLNQLAWAVSPMGVRPQMQNGTLAMVSN